MTTHRLLNRRMAVVEMGKAGLAVVVFGAAACSGTDGTEGHQHDAGGCPDYDPRTGDRHDHRRDHDHLRRRHHHGRPGRLPTGEPRFRIRLHLVPGRGSGPGRHRCRRQRRCHRSRLGRDGPAWDSVGQVIPTHKHPDHMGSVDAVLEPAPGATVYAGAPDIPEISSVTVPQPVGDGDSVFDLEIIESPGHTAGNICVLDRAAGILVAGDALVGVGGGVGPPDPSFSDDMTIALDSVRRLAGFSYEIALFGHGEPLLEGASAAVAALAEG